MTFTGLIPFIKNQTLALCAIAGEMIIASSDQEHELLVKAKQIAKTMAVEMHMIEGIQEWTCTERLSIEQVRKFQVEVGILAKACEALDHLEDHPYRRNIIHALRNILNL